MLELWQREGARRAAADRADARHVLLGAAGRVSDWYRSLAVGLGRRTCAPKPLAPDLTARARLVECLRRDLVADPGQAPATAVRIVWTGGHLDAARRLQRGLAAAARPGAPT